MLRRMFLALPLGLTALAAHVTKKPRVVGWKLEVASGLAGLNAYTCWIDRAGEYLVVGRDGSVAGAKYTEKRATRIGKNWMELGIKDRRFNYTTLYNIEEMPGIFRLRS